LFLRTPVPVQKNTDQIKTQPRKIRKEERDIFKTSKVILESTKVPKKIEK
jgi:hypothetical protein